MKLFLLLLRVVVTAAGFLVLCSVVVDYVRHAGRASGERDAAVVEAYAAEYRRCTDAGGVPIGELTSWGWKLQRCDFPRVAGR